MPRQLVPLEELSAWISDHVSQQDDCAGTTVSVQYTLQRPDDDGCNWSSSVVINLGPNATLRLVQVHLEAILPAARARFNVK